MDILDCKIVYNNFVLRKKKLNFENVGYENAIKKIVLK